MKTRSRSRQYWLLRVLGALLMTIGVYNPVSAADFPDLVVTVETVPVDSDFTQADENKTYTITVSNTGSVDTTGTITLTDTLPSGLVAVSITSSDPWICPTGDIRALTVITCTRTDPILQGSPSSVLTLTVDVAYNAGDVGTEVTIGEFLYRTVTNTVNVTGGGDQDASNIATDATRILQKPDLRITDWELRDATNSNVIGSPQPNEEFWVRMTIENRGGDIAGGFYPGVFLDDEPNYGIDHSDAPLVLGEVTDFSDYRIAPKGTQGFPDGGCLYYDPAGTIDPLSEDIKTERGNYSLLSYLPDLPANTSTTVDVQINYPVLPTNEYDNPIYDADNVRSGLSAGSYNLILYADPTCTAGESYETNNSLGPLPITVGTSAGCAAPMTGTPIFGDVPVGHWAREYVEALYTCGYTAGCSASPLMYCPSNGMTRVESSVFILRGNFGSTYVPPSSAGSFGDNWSPGPWGEKWAQGLLNAGLTAGCSSSPLLFCPWDQTPRVQLAVFGVRLRHGSSFVPPAATGTVFADMTDPNYFGTKWAEQAYADGIIPACGTSGGKPLFCPGDLVDRALAAYTVVKAKNLLP